jgi:hypothetical protein
MYAGILGLEDSEAIQVQEYRENLKYYLTILEALS